MSDCAPSALAGWPALALLLSAACTLRAGPRLVAIAIVRRCNSADAARGAWPSIATLAADTGLSRSAVVAGIKAARLAGWLVVTPGNRQQSNCYVVTAPHEVAHHYDASSESESEGPMGPSASDVTPRGVDLNPVDLNPVDLNPVDLNPAYVGLNPAYPMPESGLGSAESGLYLLRDPQSDPSSEPQRGDARPALPPSVPFQLELSEPAPIPEAKSEKSPKPKGSTIPKAPKSLTLAAWGEGIQRVTGSPWVLSGTKLTGALGTIVSTYAPKGIAGEALTAWLADAAERFARQADDFQTSRGFDPCDAKRWFSAGSPTTATTPKPNGFARTNSSQPASLPPDAWKSTRGTTRDAF